MEALERSEIVTAQILAVLLDRGFQYGIMDFSDLGLEASFRPFFFPSCEWLAEEGIMRAKSISPPMNSSDNGSVASPMITSLGLRLLAKKGVDGKVDLTLGDVAQRMATEKRSVWRVGEFLGAFAGGAVKSLSG